MTSREMESIDEDGRAGEVVDGADPFKLLAARDQCKAILAGIRALARSARPRSAPTWRGSSSRK